MSTETKGHILIIGGGIGGLCLAQSLKRSNIPFQIFERDSNIGWRAQGYRITLTAEGIEALEATLPAPLWSLFEKTAIKPTFGFTRLNAVNIQVLPLPAVFQSKEGRERRRAGKKFVVDRAVLRTLLTFGLEDNIVYSKTLTSFTTNDQDVTARFQDGTEYVGSLLVAADGASSIVRRQHIPDHLLYDTQWPCIYGKTPITDELRAVIAPEALQNTCFFSQEGLGLNMLSDPARFDGNPHDIDARLPPTPDYIYWAFIAHRDRYDVPDSELLRKTSDEAADIALALSKDWHPSLRVVLEKQDRSVSAMIRTHTSAPSIPAWAPNPHVTLIGDAAHPMLPTGASGANTALNDALKLGELLKEKGGVLNVDEMAAFEKELREQGEKKVEFSIRSADGFFGMKGFETYKPVVF